jgi:DNA-binding beta-propeller fold protein YncE
MRLRALRLLSCLAALALSGGLANAGVLVTAHATGPQLGGITGIANDGTTLFVTKPNPGANVLSVPVAGGPITPLYTYTGGGVSPLGITVLGSSLYWIDPNSGPFTDPEILKAPKDGSGPVSRIMTGSSLGFPFGVLDGSGITNDGTRLYWADEVGGRVYKIEANGSGIVQLGGDRYPFGFGSEHFNSIAYDNGMLYVADSGRPGVNAPQVVSISTSGGSFTTLFSGSPFQSPTGITVGNGLLYVADSAAQSIWSLPLTGGSPTLVVSDSRFQSIHNLTYLDGALYVADQGSGGNGTIWKVDLQAVPEPSSLALLGAGAASLAGYVWRRRRAPAP